jgi:prepilin peptidase CpaA
MGMGDVKLAASVGAWIGPGQLLIAFLASSMVGGVFAVLYALWCGSLGRCLDNTNNLLAQFAKGRMRPHNEITLANASALSIPYAPAFAIGTLFSFFA